MRSGPKRIVRGQRGQAAVEFALTATFLFFLIIALIELFMFIYTYAALANSAKEGVRYAIVHGSTGTNGTGPSTQGTAWTAPTSGQWPTCGSANSYTSSAAQTPGPVVTAVQNYAITSLHSTSAMNIYVCYPDGNNKAGSSVEVSVAYPYQPFFGLGWPTITVYANSAGRIIF